MKKVLITGSQGFIGKNLAAFLAHRTDVQVTGFDIDDDPATLPALVRETDFIFHLAGVNRPQNVEEFSTGNVGMTQTVISHLLERGNTIPMVISSSTQAAQDNPYGISKREAEEAKEQAKREPEEPAMDEEEEATQEKAKPEAEEAMAQA